MTLLSPDRRLTSTGPSGFTLIELLITITILAGITAIVYRSFASVTDATDRVRVDAEELRLRQFLSKSFMDNFSMAYAPPFELPDEEFESTAGLQGNASLLDEIEYFEGVSDGGVNGPQDVVSFWSTAPAMGGVALPGDRKIVQYEVVRDRGKKYGLSFNEEETLEEDPDIFLVASEAPILQGDDTIFEDDEYEDVDEVDFDGPSWRVPIRSMDLTYYDGAEWQDEWTYSDQQRLPWAVRIKINFAKTQERLDQEEDQDLDPKEDPDFELIVTIASGLGMANATVTGGGADRGRESARNSTNSADSRNADDE